MSADIVHLRIHHVNAQLTPAEYDSLWGIAKGVKGNMAAAIRWLIGLAEDWPSQRRVDEAKAVLAEGWQVADLALANFEADLKRIPGLYEAYEEQLTIARGGLAVGYLKADQAISGLALPSSSGEAPDAA